MKSGTSKIEASSIYCVFRADIGKIQVHYQNLVRCWHFVCFHKSAADSEGLEADLSNGNSSEKSTINLQGRAQIQTV
jgi:hypothetical protein